jgi:hypothetical protein
MSRLVGSYSCVSSVVVVVVVIVDGPTVLSKKHGTTNTSKASPTNMNGYCVN